MSGGRAPKEKAAAFRALHEGAPFVIPNPWDAGSAKLLEANGFEALATTSSGFAFTLGRPDGSVTLAEMAAHVTALEEAGGQRISLGGALTWIGTSAVTAAAERIREGDLSVLTAPSPPADWLNG